MSDIYDICLRLQEIAADLRDMQNYRAAKRTDKLASDLYPHPIKPAPIVRRTITG